MNPGAPLRMKKGSVSHFQGETAMSSELKRRGLGRGLGALIVSTETFSDGSTGSGAPAALTAGVQTVRVEDLQPNPHQPRTTFDPTTLQELAASIRAHGIIQPLVVTTDPTHAGAYWIVAGERRWRAAQLAGLETVPVAVREASQQQFMEWALVENVQRDDLNPLEEAAAYQALLEEFGLTQVDVAERVGKSRSAVAKQYGCSPAPGGTTGHHRWANHGRACVRLAGSADRGRHGRRPGADPRTRSFRATDRGARETVGSATRCASGHSAASPHCRIPPTAPSGRPLPGGPRHQSQPKPQSRRQWASCGPLLQRR